MGSTVQHESELGFCATVLGTKPDITPLGRVFITGQDQTGSKVSIEAIQANDVTEIVDVCVTNPTGQLIGNERFTNPNVVIAQNGVVKLSDPRLTRDFIIGPGVPSEFIASNSQLRA